MRIKPNYILIPLTTILVAVLGSLLTAKGMQWYDTTLIQPSITPPKWAFPVAWNLIFATTTLSALNFWNLKKSAKYKNLIALLFILNAVLNIFWSCLFFFSQAIVPSFAEMLFLEADVLLLIILIWKSSKISSILLLPYLLWVGFTTYLTYQILILNS